MYLTKVANTLIYANTLHNYFKKFNLLPLFYIILSL